MKIFVKVKAWAKEESVKKIDPPAGEAGDAHFIVAVKEGRANWAVARALAEYFKIAPSRVELVSGFSSKEKVFEIK